MRNSSRRSRRCRVELNQLLSGERQQGIFLSPVVGELDFQDSGREEFHDRAQLTADQAVARQVDVQGLWNPVGVREVVVACVSPGCAAEPVTLGFGVERLRRRCCA